MDAPTATVITGAAESQEQDVQVLFRPGKKRKIYRQRATDAEDGTTETQSTQPPPAIAAAAAAPELLTAAPATQESGTTPTEEEMAVAEALRLRHARRPRLRGVEFRREDAGGPGANTEQSLVLRDGGGDSQSDAVTLSSVQARFAPQTGLVGRLVNKHMEEYVESALAKRHAADGSPPPQQQQQQQQQSSSFGSDSAGGAASGYVHKKLVEGSGPTMKGKLHEIDLGDEVRARNIALTERATRRLIGGSGGSEDDDEEEDDGTGKPKRPRLGRDGKPWRPRKRRASEDIKRDQLVEQFLHENKHVYDMGQVEAGLPAAATTTTTTTTTDATAAADEDDLGAADDRIAEQFRREYMEALSQRIHRRRHPPSNSRPGQSGSKGGKGGGAAGGKKDEEILRGPKLGGSRNVRAAMRDKLLKQEQQKRGKV